MELLILTYIPKDLIIINSLILCFLAISLICLISISDIFVSYTAFITFMLYAIKVVLNVPLAFVVEFGIHLYTPVIY